MKNNYLPLPILFVLLFGLTMTLYAQNGEPCFSTIYLQNPFGIMEPNVSALVKLVDIDHDDTLEVFVGANGGSYILRFYENAGSNMAPEFINPQPDPFGLNTIPFQYIDIDGDSLHEAFIGHFSDNAPITMIDNTGNANTPNFQGDEEPDPYGITLPVSSDGNVLDNAFPAFVDIDNDGDYDVFITGRFINFLSDEALFFMQNKGTSTSPKFDTLVANPFNFDFQLGEHPYFAIFEDMDCDGDFDMYLNPIPTNVTFYFENKGTPEVADFSIGGGNPTSIYDTPFSPGGSDFMDIEGDGDMDLINGSYNAGIQFYKNSSSTTVGCPCAVIINVKENEFDGKTTLAPNPAQDELKLNIRSEFILKNIACSIHDVTGRQVLSVKLTPVGRELLENIDVSHLQPGLYFIKININEQSFSKKILISR